VAWVSMPMLSESEVSFVEWEHGLRLLESWA